MRGRRRREQAVGDLVSAALKDLGVPPTRVSAPLAAAFERAVDPAWRGQLRLERMQGGVLEVGVASASLRDELAQFHAPRLLAVMREAVPGVSLVQLRFVTVASSHGASMAPGRSLPGSGPRGEEPLDPKRPADGPVERKERR